MRLRPKPYTKKERESYMNFIKPLSTTPMSIWDNEQFQQGEAQYDDSTSIFMSQRLKKDGASTTVKFTDLQYQTQPEEKHEAFKDDDGKAYVFYFEDGDKEITYETAKKNNMFYKAMLEAKVEIGETITITRNGLEFDTNYVITRPEAGFVPPTPNVEEKKPEEPATDVPF